MIDLGQSSPVGEREIKAWELAKLAEMYGRDIDFFLNLESIQKEVRILWRSPEASPQKTTVERQFISICKRYQNLLKLLEEPNIPKTVSINIDKHELLAQSAFKYVEDLASTYIRILDLGSRPACSLPKILEEEMGIKIIFLQEELEKGTIKDVDKKNRHSDWAETVKPYLSNRYISLAIKAFHLGKISKGKLAEYVGENYSAIPSFLNKYGYDENEDYSIAYRTA